MADKKEMRKTVYVSRMIQGRLLERLGVYWVVYHFVLWHTMFLYRYLQYRGELLAGAPPMPFAELYGTFVAQHYSMVISALAVLPLVFWDMLRQTHRVAGPLVRFQNALRQLAAGEPVEKIRLRRGDLLIEFQECFNEFLDEMQRTGRLSLAPATPDSADAAASEDLVADAQRTDVLHELLEDIERELESSDAPAAEPAEHR